MSLLLFAVLFHSCHSPQLRDFRRRHLLAHVFQLPDPENGLRGISSAVRVLAHLQDLCSCYVCPVDYPMLDRSRKPAVLVFRGFTPKPTHCVISRSAAIAFSLSARSSSIFCRRRANSSSLISRAPGIGLAAAITLPAVTFPAVTFSKPRCRFLMASAGSISPAAGN